MGKLEIVPTLKILKGGKDPVKLKYSFVQNQTVYNALASLYKKEMSPNTAYKVKKFIDEVEKASKGFQAKHKELVDSFCEKDADGNIVSQTNEEGVKIGFKVQEGKGAELNVAYQALLEEEFEIARTPIFVAELTDAKISPEHLMALEPIIADMDNLGN
jgi:hypothetical protein